MSSRPTEPPATMGELERKEHEQWERLVKHLFQATLDLSFGVPAQYRQGLFESMVIHILDQHWGGTEFERAFVYQCYQTYVGERYKTPEEREREEQSDDE